MARIQKFNFHENSFLALSGLIVGRMRILCMTNRVERFWANVTDHCLPFRFHGGKSPEQLLFYNCDLVVGKKIGKDRKGGNFGKNKQGLSCTVNLFLPNSLFRYSITTIDGKY